jgi:hypothetical protein
MSDDPRKQRYAGDYYSNYMLFRAEADVAPGRSRHGIPCPGHLNSGVMTSNAARGSSVAKKSVAKFPIHRRDP